MFANILTNNILNSMGFPYLNQQKFSTVVVKFILLLTLTDLKVPTDRKHKKWKLLFFKISDIFLYTFIASVRLEHKSQKFSM